MATWYVRPNTSHSGSRDGTSYATAWGGWSEIVWGGAGVVGGDTLYVCGAHSSSSTLNVGAHGGSSDGTRCIIRGDYTADPGSITFSGSVFLSNARAYTTIRNLSITAGTSNAIFMDAAGSNSRYQFNRLTGGSAPILNFNAATGQSHANVEISDNYFTGNASTGAIRALITGTSTWNIDGLQILRNTFESVTVTRAVIHLRMESTVNAASAFDDIEIKDNRFIGCVGLSIEVNSGTGRVSVSDGLEVTGNRFEDCTIGSGFGGCISLSGSQPGGTLGTCLVEKNYGRNMAGVSGFCNIFYGSYVVRNNVATDLTSTTIDACGVLFDLGCVDCEAYHNTFKRLTPGAAVDNISVGIMILGDCSNIRAYENVIEGCKVGVHVGAGASGQTNCIVERNVFTGVTTYGVDVKETADRSVIVRNNVFSAETTAALPVRVIGTAWGNENSNVFHGFGSPSNHTIGSESSTSAVKYQKAFVNSFVNPNVAATL